MNVVNWLLESEPWVQYATSINILKHNKKELVVLRDNVLADNNIQSYLNDITNFHNMLVTNHKNPDLPIHKLIFLLDIGLDENIVQINNALQQILKLFIVIGLRKRL